MPTTEEAYEWLQENAPQDIADALDKNQLREENKKLAGRVQELEPKAAQLEKLEKAPSRTEAFKKRNIDLTKLRPLEKKAVENFDDFEDDDKLTAFIQEAQLEANAEGAEGGGQGGETPTPVAGQIANQASNAGGDAGRNGLEAEIAATKNPQELTELLRNRGVSMVSE